MLLTAELAGQRGQYDIAMEGYLEAAKRVDDPRFAERAVVIAMFIKNTGKAQESLAIWLRQAPKNPEARKVAALLALRDGDQAKAVEHFDVLLGVSSADDFEKSVLEVASVLQKEGQLRKMTGVLSALSAKHADQAIVPYLQSFFWAQLNDKAQAEVYIEKTLKIKPDWDKALVWQAQIAVFSGDFSKAETILRYAVSKYPENPKIKRLLAQVLVKSDQYEEAGTVFEEILEANPSDYESQLSLGLVYLQDGQDDDAEDIFKKLQERPDWRNQSSFYMGKLEEKRGKLPQAVAWFDKVSDGPLAFDASVSSIMLMVKQKQFNEASLKASAMMGKFPKEKVRILLIQSEVFNKQKNYRQAFNLLTTALTDMHDEESLLYTRALMAEKLAKFDLMEADLQKILEKNPKNAEALNALGYSLANRTSRYAEAEQYLSRALAVRPNEPVIVDSYGWVLFKKGQALKALDFLQKAYAKQKESEIAAHLVEVLWSLGRKDEANGIFSEAIKAAPDDEFLLEVQQRLLKNAQ
ncbi:tetratricopeptide repeat protein [Methylosoma difficile]